MNQPLSLQTRLVLSLSERPQGFYRCREGGEGSRRGRVEGGRARAEVTSHPAGCELHAELSAVRMHTGRGQEASTGTLHLHLRLFGTCTGQQGTSTGSPLGVSL